MQKQIIALVTTILLSAGVITTCAIRAYKKSLAHQETPEEHPTKTDIAPIFTIGYPLGTTVDNQEVYWDNTILSTLLISGKTGSGTSVITGNLLRAVSKDPQNEVHVFDATGDFNGTPNPTRTLRELERLAKNLASVARERWEEASESEGLHYTKLDNPPHDIFLFLNHFGSIESGALKATEKKRYQEVIKHFETIAAHRGVGIHIIATENPNNTLAYNDASFHFNALIKSDHPQDDMETWLLPNEAVLYAYGETIQYVVPLPN